MAAIRPGDCFRVRWTLAARDLYPAVEVTEVSPDGFYFVRTFDPMGAAAYPADLRVTRSELLPYAPEGIR